MTQLSPHPSPLSEFPSSHYSGGLSCAFPQRVKALRLGGGSSSGSSASGGTGKQAELPALVRMHFHPGSTSQPELHPSEFARFPLSQPSPVSRKLFPHRVILTHTDKSLHSLEHNHSASTVQMPLQPSPSRLFPSSQPSLLPSYNKPLPHKGSRSQ